MTNHRDDRLRTLMVLALAISCADLWTKIALPTPGWALHQRSFVWALGCGVLLIALVPLARIPSTAVTVGAGLFGGGVLGNLVSAGTDHLAVPNPLFVQTGEGWFAFNLADASILLGNIVLMVALSAILIRNRERLPAWRGSVRTRMLAGCTAQQESRQR